MKKIFTLVVSLGTLSTVFAQSNNYYPQQRDDRNVTYQDKSYSHQTYDKNANTVAYGYAKQSNNGGYDRQRQNENDRNNRDYDRQNGGYRNDRSPNVYERDRRIQEAPRAKNNQLKTLGTGIILGGILGVLLGSQL